MYFDFICTVLEDIKEGDYMKITTGKIERPRKGSK